MADGGGARGGRRTPAWPGLLRYWALAGIVAAVGGLTVRILAPNVVLFLLGSVVLLLGSLAFITSAIAAVARGELRGQENLVTSTAERWLVEVLPPARVLTLLLDRVYGESESNRAVVTALLGGQGLLVDRSDLTISERTDIYYRLNRVDAARYQLVMRAEYTFRTRVLADTVVIFATSDTSLRDSIVSACRLPLFELWYIREDENTLPFAESVELMKESVRIGMVYLDDAGNRHDVAAIDPAEHVEDMRLTEWSRYLSMFRTEEQHAMHPADYMDRLRIFRVRLHDLAAELPTVARVERLTVQSSATQQVVDQFCYWQAPYPCFVENMGFDTTSFAMESEPDLRFHLKPFTLGTSQPLPSWGADGSGVVVVLKKWVLVGHGVALMWRPGGRESNDSGRDSLVDRHGPGEPSSPNHRRNPLASASAAGSPERIDSHAAESESSGRSSPAAAGEGEWNGSHRDFGASGP